MQLIPTEVAERIAAGEVVDRPSSVVKELLENSLDAQAQYIEIELEDGGQTLLRITDDGLGMTFEDAILSVERHATSKLRAWEDLESLCSFGFRGEALPSIAAVSRFEMTTTARGEKAGTRVTLHGPGKPTVERAPGPEGTRIEVRDLFWNTPARRKFLKSPAGETARISDLVSRFAVLNPEVSFRLLVNNVEKLFFPLEASQAERLGQYWKLQPDDLIEVSHQRDHLKVEGVLADPKHHRRNRAHQILAVNGRLIMSASLSKAISEGFDPLLPRGRYPFALINIVADPAAIDVNIHPTKSEVRFADERSPFRATYKSVSQALEDNKTESVRDHHWRAALTGSAPSAENHTHPVPPLVTNSSFRASALSGTTRQSPLAIRPQRPLQPSTDRVMEFFAPDSSPDENSEPAPESRSPVDSFETRDAQGKLDLHPDGPEAEIRYLTRLYGSYLVMQVDRCLWVIDQHAAHERINYEKFHRFQIEGPESQRLLLPTTLELKAHEFLHLEQHRDHFRELGFEFELEEGCQIRLTSVPPILKSGTENEFFIDLVSELVNDELTVKDGTLNRYREHLRALMACKASVRARERVSPEEAEHLTRDLLRAERSPYCPHGRPTRIRLDEAVLERLFHRH